MRINIFVSVFVFFASGSTNIFSQTYLQPNYALKSHETLEILKVEVTKDKTIINFAIENRIEGGTFCADRNIYLIDYTGNKYKVEKSSGIPVCPDNYKFKSIGEKLHFTLIFPPLNSGIRWVDIIEDCKENCFSFFGVTLNEDLNTKVDAALSMAESSKKTGALDLYKNIFNKLDQKDLGIKGALYIDIITLSLETGDKAGASEWYKKMVSSDVPHLNLFVKNLNSRGIKF